MKLRPALLVAVLALGISVPLALACKCAPPPPPKEALAQAGAVFAGRIVAETSPQEGNRRVFTVEVARVWKGGVAARTTISTPKDSAACGYEFEAGKSYLIYASADGKTLATISCSRTRPFEDKGEDVQALGAGQPPAATPAPTPAK